MSNKNSAFIEDLQRHGRRGDASEWLERWFASGVEPVALADGGEQPDESMHLSADTQAPWPERTSLFALASVPTGIPRTAAILFVEGAEAGYIYEDRQPDDILACLFEFYELSSVVIEEYGGSIEVFGLDGITCSFPDSVDACESPGRDEGDDAYRAMLCAFELRRATDMLNRLRRSRREPEVKINIGAAFGSVGRYALSFGQCDRELLIGEAVDLAQKLSRYAADRGAGIVMSDAFVEAARVDGSHDGYPPIQQIGRRSVPGRSTAMKLWCNA